MLRILVVALVLLVAAIMWRPQPGSNAASTVTATVLPQARELPAVQLVDQTGAPFTFDALHGKFTLLFFGFANCPDVCPLTLKQLADARAEIAARAPATVPNVLFVSVDAARDTPERIAAYVRAFDPSFMGATAADSELAPLLKTLGVAVARHDHGGGAYNVMHSDAIFVLGPRAEWIAVSTGPHDPKTIAADYLRIRRSYRPTDPTPPSA